MFTRLLNKCLWLSGLCLFCLIYGFLIEPATLRIKQVSIALEDWDSPPIRIAFLADIHIGGEHVSPKRVLKIVEKVKAEKPDLVLIGGDFVDGHTRRSKLPDKFNRKVEGGLKILGQLGLDQTVVAVIGNHDVWYNKTFVKNTLEKSGVIVLDNSAYRLNEQICIVGLADDFTETPSIIGHKDCKIGDDVIALMHSPDSFELLRPSTDLALAGHTHGGQINLPIIGRRITSTRAGKEYAYGKVDFNGISGYVTSGIGTSILPARFRSAPEIVVIEIN